MVESLKPLRARLGLSQPELAGMLGVHAMTVSKWERGVLAPNEHQARILRALTVAAEAGLRTTPPERGGSFDPVQFLAAALSHASVHPTLDLGALSATNRFPGKVVEILRGDVMSKLLIEVAPGVRVGSVITTDSVDRLGFTVGSRAMAIIKATEVILGKL